MKTTEIERQDNKKETNKRRYIGIDESMRQMDRKVHWKKRDGQKQAETNIDSQR